MKTFFEELFDYTHYFNLQLITAFSEKQLAVSDKAVEILNHIFTVHDVWNSRILRVPLRFAMREQHNPEDYQKITTENLETSKRILTDYDLNTVISYSNTKGRPFTNSVRDILFQIINHSTYHRGQIAMEFRKAGLEPLVTEYIMYKR